MKTLQRPARTSLSILSYFAAVPSFAFAALALMVFAGGRPAQAQTSRAPLPDRISGPISNSSRVPLAGSASPRAMRSTDLGAVDARMPLTGMTLVFSRSDAQQQDLNQLLAAQQNSSSPLYHQWLTPVQFGARFGVSDDDLAATESWLQSQGFTIVALSPSRDSITFSGSASSVESAFGTQLHYFRATSGSMTASADTLTHFAPAQDLTLPSALSPVVLAVGNLSDYRPRSHAIKRPTAAFTSSVSGSHYLTPADIATIYDLSPAYSAGYYGSGQTIVVAGQSAVVSTDITNFQTALGVSNAPTLTVVPGSGASTVYTGDEAESDLDLEYTSTIASKASINFIYTGSSNNFGVFDSIVYAIQNKLGTIITVSYGECEPDLGQANFTKYEAYFQQAAAQGQTVINSSGDSGSTACYGDTSSTTAAAIANQQQLAVSYPASSVYVTGLGGTEFPLADTVSTNSIYFTAANGSDVLSSAVSYIPEQAWNDDSTAGLSAGGGGVSIYAARPAWQTGVTGISNGSYRLVPDISLDSSPNDAGYLYCSSDNGTDGVGFAGSCTSGLRVSSAYTNAQGLTVAGGTSFAAPIFAGMLAIINQAKGYNTGQGLVNPTLYTLAANPTTYASAFHDITAGSNACTSGTTVCGSGAATTSYATTTGYDEATGLGSIDLYKLLTAWPKTSSTSNLLNSTLTATAATSTPATSATDAITLQVTCASGTLCTGAVPSGTITIADTVNGTTTTATGSPIALANGGAIYTYTAPSTGGVHQIVFTYSGDSVYATSKATVNLTVGSASFTIAATSVSLTAGSSGTTTVTVTSVNGYAGTVNLSLYNSSVAYACYSGPSTVAVTATTPGKATYTLSTNASSCASGATTLRRGGSVAASNASHPSAPVSPWRGVPAPIALAGLLIACGFNRRSKLLRSKLPRVGVALAFVAMLGLSGLGLTGCSNNAPGVTTPAPTTPTTATAAGSYSVSVSGIDSVNSTVTASSTFTLTVN